MRPPAASRPFMASPPDPDRLPWSPIAGWFPLAWDQPWRRPLRIELWGRPVVVFRDEEGKPAALEDRCPHRGMPLSSGRCDQGGIRCAYHGWRFDRDGRCVEIPALNRAESHRRVPRYPVRTGGGLVWIYSQADTEPDEAPPVPHEGGRPLRLEADFEAGVPLVLENILDVPHTAYVHAGAFRTRRAAPVQVRLEPHPQGAQARFLDEPRPNGWLARLLAPQADRVEHVDRYLHPCIAEVEYRLGRHRVVLSSALRPDHPTRTHLFTTAWIEGPGPWAAAARLLEPFGRRILAQDRRILDGLQRNLQHFGAGRWGSSEADLLGPVILRAWRRAAEGRPRVPVAEREVTLWM